MIIDNSKKILIVGLGLLGGSYAMALKRKGYDVSAITLEQKSIDYALEHKLIDRGFSHREASFLLSLVALALSSVALAVN